MIKFFRRVRQNLLSETNFSKPASPAGRYMLYAIGEIVLVVLGILIALSINNWNSHRIDNNKELTYLKRLQTDVLKQIEVLESIGRFCDYEVILADSILSKFKSAGDLRSVGDLDKKLSVLMYSMVVSKANTTFNELSTTGQLNLIKSDTIRTKLIEFYTNIDRLDNVVTGNRENVYYPNVFPIFLEVMNLDIQNFFPSEKQFTTNFFTKGNDEVIRVKLENPELQRKLLNAITLVIMTNKTIKSSTQQSAAEGEELMSMLQID